MHFSKNLQRRGTIGALNSPIPKQDLNISARLNQLHDRMALLALILLGGRAPPMRGAGHGSALGRNRSARRHRQHYLNDCSLRAVLPDGVFSVRRHASNALAEERRQCSFRVYLH